jgi:hypothetical protein
MIDPKEAPEGYEAVEGVRLDCDLWFLCGCDKFLCTPEDRQDGERVIFRKVEE